MKSLRPRPGSVVDDYSKRLSFTCGRCDKRATPESVRFLGRRVYAAVVLMLVSPPGATPGQALCDLLTIPERTVSRWRSWWSRDFVRTAFWQSVRERFAIAVLVERLPQSLIERFAGDTCAMRMLQLLRFVAPLSTRAVVM